MLATLSSYIWGEEEPTAQEDTASPPGVPKDEQIVENDWIFVKPKDYFYSHPETPTKRRRQTRIDGDDDSVTSSDSATSQESWLVEPPSCFNGKRKLESTNASMENLLIEHPSMSIYQGSNLASGESSTCEEPRSSAVATRSSNCHRAVAGRLQEELEYRQPLKELAAKVNHETKRTTRSSLKRKNQVAASPHQRHPRTKQMGRIAGKHTGMVGKRGS